MDEIVDATDTVRSNSSAPGRPTDPTTIVTEALVEALAALDADRLVIRRTKRAVADIYATLHERDERISRSVVDIQRGYRVAETLVAGRQKKRIA